MKKIELQTVVSFAEIISALAIVVSLIYAVNEFRRSQTITSRDVENIAYTRMMELDRLLVENPDFAGIYESVLNEPDLLSRTDSIRFTAFEHIYYDSWETLWYYFHEGVMDKSAWDSWNEWFLSDSRKRPLIGWVGNRKNYAGGFLDMVDRELLPQEIIKK